MPKFFLASRLRTTYLIEIDGRSLADAKRKAKESGKEPIFFIEHDELLDLFAEFNIGIRHEPVRFYQVDASQYDFLK